MKCNNVVYYLFHGSICTVTLYICYLSMPGSSLFSWHPSLMTVAMLLLMNEAIVIFSPFWTILPAKYYRPWCMTSHVTLEIGAFLGIIIGFLAIYVNKEEHEKPHFVSWHGLVGLIGVILAIIQVILGTAAKYATTLSLPFDANVWKLIHDVSGIINVLLGIFSLVSGLYTNWFVALGSLPMFYISFITFVVVNTFVSVRVLVTNKRIMGSHKG